MGMLILGIVFYLVYASIDYVSICKEQNTRVKGIYIVLFGLSFVLQILILLDVDIPSPANPIKNIVEAIIK